MYQHWENAVKLFSLLAYMVKEADPDGLDLYFTISTIGSEDHIKKRHTSDLVEAALGRRCEEMSDITIQLGHVLHKYQTKLRKHADASRLKFGQTQPVRPMTVYIFTDGLWKPDCDPTRLILELVETLDRTIWAGGRQLGVQFIQFGHDPWVTDKLDKLDNLKKTYPLKR